MSTIARLLSFVRAIRQGVNVPEVTVDTGGGVNHTADHFAPVGDDSHPLPTDYVLVTEIPQSGSKIAIAYLDSVNAGETLEGEKRIYARDPNTGTPVNQVWLKNNGDVLLSNDNGSILLQADGTVNINGVTIDPSGNIDTPGSISAPSMVVNGVELATHTHAQPNDGAGDVEQNTTGPI